MKKTITTLLIAACAFLLAQGATRSTSKPSGSWSSKSSSFSNGKKTAVTPNKTPTTQKPSSSWSNKPATSPSKTPTNPKSKTDTRTAPVKRTAAQEAAYKKAAQSGTAFKTKEAAATDFKAKNAAKYTSAYSTRPATRPEHIPQTYSSGGRTYNVTYDVRHGGYGYMNSLGAWVMYDAMADAMMMDRLMARNGYYYDPVPVATVHRQSSGVGFIIFLSIVGGVIVVSLVILVISERF